MGLVLLAVALCFFSAALTNAQGECKDTDVKGQCKEFKDAGYCDQKDEYGKPTPTAQYMKEACPKTCEFCGEKAGEQLGDCKDERTDCKDWKDMDYCKDNHPAQSWAKDNCRKTCEFCKQ